MNQRTGTDRLLPDDLPGRERIALECLRNMYLARHGAADSRAFRTGRASGLRFALDLEHSPQGGSVLLLDAMTRLVARSPALADYIERGTR